MSVELPAEYTKAFKDADIRGVYPSQINEAVAYRTARAFVELFELSEVVVGRDMRVSSPSLRDAFVQGAIDAGADVLDIGLVATPAVYYVSGSKNLCGVMITASHNPKEYNGLKLVKAGAIPLTNASGLQEIEARVLANEFKDVEKKGAVTEENILEEYRTYVLSKIDIAPPRNIRVVADAGNGMATLLAPLLLEELPLETKQLFFELDGTFPNRDSNPTLRENQDAIIGELQQGGHDFGVSFDGDVDRVAFFDEKGRYINSAVIGALIAKHLLREMPNSKFVYTVFTSKIYEETITKYGGEAVRARVGHAFIKELMREQDAVFASEHSAHFYFKDNFYADSGILAFLYLLAACADALKEGKTFSDMLDEFMVYHQTEELLVEVSDKKNALEEVLRVYGEQDPVSTETFDGVSIAFADYWFVVKESVTEDALKFVVEAREEKLAEEKKQEIFEMLKQL